MFRKKNFFSEHYLDEKERMIDDLDRNHRKYGFFCYFFYDINSVTWKNKFLQRFFLVGTLLVAFATGSMIVRDWKTIEDHPLQAVLFGTVALVFFCRWSIRCFLHCHLKKLTWKKIMSGEPIRRACMHCAVIRGFSGLLCFIWLWPE